MSSTERLVFGGSLLLNAVLIITVIFLFINRPDENNPGAVAQIEPTASTPTEIPPSQTPLVVTVIATPTAMPALEATPTEVPLEPTVTAVPTETPMPTLEPTATLEPSPTPQPTPTEAVYTGPDWLRYTNRFRAQAGLPLVTENTQLSAGAANHSYYMVLNSSSSHNEDPNLPGYTESGLQAGRNGNIAISGVAGTNYNWAIDYWISAAFHTIPLLDPGLEYVGYGQYNDANSSFGMGATLDVKSGLRADTTGITYPIMFPRDGGETWVTTYSMPEFPNTATGCTGYQKPTGAPIILMLGNGDTIPQIRETRLLEGGTAVAHCAFDETNYYNPDAYWQETGRNILHQRDAVVILPRAPLKVGEEYTVYVNNGGDEIEWTFSVVANPLLESEE